MKKVAIIALMSLFLAGCAGGFSFSPGGVSGGVGYDSAQHHVKK